jgi:3-ketosteroid 9alpha-monooxygenase subunit A
MAKIEGDAIRCPMHSWQYDAHGTCIDVPYSDRVNKQAKIRTYPVVERMGGIYAWYHPTNEPPAWELPELEAFGGGPEYSSVHRKHYSLGCHWQEIAETQVDAAHIQAHLIDYQIMLNGGVRPDKPTMPQVDSYQTDGPIAEIRITQDFPTPQGAVQGRIDTDAWGPGVAATWFTGLVDTLLLGCATPVDESSCELRYSFVVRSDGDAKASDRLAAGSSRRSTSARWKTSRCGSRRRTCHKPALAHGDGPILQYRRWCEQFYAEGVDRSQPVWEPTEVTV